ncbi:hypothetical protein RAT170B_1682 [Rickettsia argasii T170-B]|uniref:Uncharacterized protein n=1 Tax=Rickettsia argasii T170-B TaxID=1268837 RepID=A0A0F3RBD8_9RICK|nr:hypothetical protein RAT170B_1682 [Rickettsia argasii T170-B]
MMLTHHGAHGKLKLLHLEDGGLYLQRDYQPSIDTKVISDLSTPLKYIKHERQNNVPSFVDEKQIAITFDKVKAEVKELRLERELEHTMTMRL